MIQCARQPGLAGVWSSIMGFDGAKTPSLGRPQLRHLWWLNARPAACVMRLLNIGTATAERRRILEVKMIP